MAFLRRCVTFSLLLLAGLSASSQPAGRFDLPGPKIDIRVTRAGVLLPIASVPNLQPGDQIWLHPDLPPTQSVHYLLIATFLRGTTNPPPDNWFIRIETWDKKVREEGVTVTVPEEAQQAILFLAPETGGDFSTLRSAVKGRPGIFVRASQDLAEAGFEQGRIEKYLAALKQVPPGDLKALQDHSDLLARTLALKPNPDCARRPLDQQYTCLTQVGTQTLLDDGHAQSIAAALSNGPGSDFINQASYTGLAGAGVYSAYVGAIVDLVRLTSGLHTAKYQYIPAIAFPPTADSPDQAPATLDLRLNTPPSFNNPKSVIVIGLPAVQKSVTPPLRPVDANHISCLLDPHLALPIEGAPLVFSTAFAHGLVLHLDQQNKDIPLVPDAYQGGLVLAANPTPERHELPPAGVTTPPVSVPQLGTDKAAPAPKSDRKPDANPGEPVIGTIEGFWGFDHFDGPKVALQQTPGGNWHIVGPAAASAGPAPATLIVGQPNHLQLISTGTACVESVALEPADSKLDWKLAAPPAPKDLGKPAAAASKPPAPEPVEVSLNLPHDTAPGSIRFAVQQFGQKDPDIVAATAFVEPARIESLAVHAGDSSALLTGTALDQVKSLSFNNLIYTPQASCECDKSSGKTLSLALPSDAQAPSLKPNDRLTAEVHLRDGRAVPVSTLVLPPRPAVSILSRRVSNAAPSPVQLASNTDLALGSQLVFFLKSKAPFSRTDQIEIANQPDEKPSEAASAVPPESIHTTLSVTSGALVLQDAHTILATFDPLKTFGPSTFGPFELRPIAADGTPGEWVPLATIVRLPTLTSLVCPADPAANCTLNGTALYLIDSISLDPAFTASTKVPEGFVDTSVAIPHPAPGTQPATFYLRLRDDASTAQQVTLSVQSDSPTPPPARNRRSSSATSAQSAPPQAAPQPQAAATPPQ